MGNRYFEPLYERYGAVRSARDRQRHHELSQGRYPRCERDKADFDSFAAVIRKYMGIPELIPPPAIAGAFGKKTIVLPIRWTAAVGGRSRLPKVPSGNENSTRTRGFPRGREKGRAAWQRPCCPARYFPLWVCRLCAALSKSVRRGIRSLFFCGREQGARARRRELLSPIKSPCWQVRKGSCRRSGR